MQPRPGDEITSLLTRDILKDHLRMIGQLDGSRLLSTLVPHQVLPDFDPAGHVIARHSFGLKKSTAVDESYDLGVVFARSLVKRVAPDGKFDNVVSDIYPARRQVVNDYLERARYVPVEALTRRGDPQFKELNRSVLLFARRCETLLPDLMLDGDEEMLRGVHDYLSVLTLLETEPGKEHAAYDRLVGKRKFTEWFTRSRMFRAGAHQQ